MKTEQQKASSGLWPRTYRGLAAAGRKLLGLLPDSAAQALGRALARAIPNPMDRLMMNTIQAGPLAGMKIYGNALKSRAYIEGGHEPEVVAWLQEHCSPGTRAVDIGSHEGYLMLLMARQVGPAGEVFAFEPIPDLYEGLRKTLGANKLDWVRVENKAMGEAKGRQQIHLQESGRSASHSMAPAEDSEKVLEIQVSSLDSYFGKLSWPRIDLIKIDVEGYEAAVFRGASRFFEEQKPKLILELHLWNDPLELVEGLDRLGYRFEQLDGRACTPGEIKERYTAGRGDTMIVVGFPRERG